MRTIEDMAKAYADGVISCNPQHEESKGLIHTAYIAGAQDALEKQWRSAEEEVPEYNKDVLIKYQHGTTIGRYTEEKKWYNGYISPIEGSVYWMPFPDPPITREEKEHNARCEAYRRMRAGAKDEKDLKDRINAFRSGKVDW